ncbi:MAG: GAF domain-containing protein [Chloroflexi bacterium]|nr:GAF domain-containing protein [Chloroflexota bacterium]
MDSDDEIRSTDAAPAERAFDALIDFLAREAVQVIDADRSSIFIYDEERHELWSRVALGVGRQVIRFPADRGIAGHVLTTGVLINVADPYADPRFNPDVDRQTGYRTHSILCGPLRAGDGRSIGVLQVLNRRGGGAFPVTDVESFKRLAVRCGLAIDNALTYERLRAAEVRGDPPRVSGPKLLLINDDAELGRRVFALLAGEFEVVEESGHADVAARAAAEQPDVVLLAVDGDRREVFATCRALRACGVRQDTPIIMLGSSAPPEYVVQAFEAGANDFLVRPFAPAQLRAKTHTWLMRAGRGGDPRA